MDEVKQTWRAQSRPRLLVCYSFKDGILTGQHFVGQPDQTEYKEKEDFNFADLILELAFLLFEYDEKLQIE